MSATLRGRCAPGQASWLPRRSHSERRGSDAWREFFLERDRRSCQAVGIPCAFDLTRELELVDRQSGWRRGVVRRRASRRLGPSRCPWSGVPKARRLACGSIVRMRRRSLAGSAVGLEVARPLRGRRRSDPRGPRSGRRIGNRVAKTRDRTPRSSRPAEVNVLLAGGVGVGKRDELAAARLQDLIRRDDPRAGVGLDAAEVAGKVRLLEEQPSVGGRFVDEGPADRRRERLRRRDAGAMNRQCSIWTRWASRASRTGAAAPRRRTDCCGTRFRRGSPARPRCEGAPARSR